MIEVKCVFDVKQIDEFFLNNKVKKEVKNDIMYFGIYEDGKLIGLTALYPKEGRAYVEKAVMQFENEMYEEFLLKTAINYALTCNSEEIEVDGYYQNFLLPMNFKKMDESFIAKSEEVDFPSKCKGNK